MVGRVKRWWDVRYAETTVGTVQSVGTAGHDDAECFNPPGHNPAPDGPR